jgi:glycosyltransferase involved in cell wall biosynthesis
MSTDIQRKIVSPVRISNQNWTEGVTPLVSIINNTYNHENFIREALESFLMQETTFPVEILVHDDASTDRTAEIIKEYELKYPDLVLPVYQKENQFSKGVKPTQNFQYPRARGKYIALCEGDDYWTDPLKLQKQVEFLEANEEYSAATHQTLMIFENNYIFHSRQFNKLNNNCSLNIDSLLVGRKFHTASILFQSNVLRDVSMPSGITSGDRALFFLIASKGLIYFFSEIMCVYRKNAGGISSWVTSEMMKKDLNMLPWLKEIYPSFPTRLYAKFIHKTIILYPLNVSFKVIFKHYFLFLYYSFNEKRIDFNEIKVFTNICMTKLLRKILKKKSGDKY